MVEKSVKEGNKDSVVIYRVFISLDVVFYFQRGFKTLPVSTTGLPVYVQPVNYWWICYLFMELPSNRLFNCKILAGIFALAFMILLPPSGYLDTAIDDLSMIVFFLLSVSVDKDDDNLITALFYFKLVVAIMVLLAYNGHLIHDVSGIRPHTEIVRHSYGMALCIQTHLDCFSLL